MTDKKLVVQPPRYLSDFDLDFTETELRFLLIIFNSTNPGPVATTENYKAINLKYAFKVLDEVEGLSEKGYLIVNAIMKKLKAAKPAQTPAKEVDSPFSKEFVEELETLLIGKESQEIHFPQVVALIQMYKNKNNPMLQ